MTDKNNITKSFSYYKATLVISELHKSNSIILSSTLNFSSAADADDWLDSQEAAGLNLQLTKNKYHYARKVISETIFYH